MVFDISQEVFSCRVYPGHQHPSKEQLCSLEQGDVCNLTAFSMCAHNGTHVDAPTHFIKNGKTIDQIELDACVGDCYVVRREGDLTAENVHEILEQARMHDAAERILIVGNAVVTVEAAQAFARERTKLVGIESQAFGAADTSVEVHRILLGAEVVLLEGLVLEQVPEGKYLLSAVPLNLGGCEGAPCRAVLIQN